MYKLRNSILDKVKKINTITTIIKKKWSNRKTCVEDVSDVYRNTTIIFPE